MQHWGGIWNDGTCSSLASFVCKTHNNVAGGGGGYYGGGSGKPIEGGGGAGSSYMSNLHDIDMSDTASLQLNVCAGMYSKHYSSCSDNCGASAMDGCIVIEPIENVPTTFPTPMPTSPTGQPTGQPSKPTTEPTAYPSISSTDAPTAAPSVSPTTAVPSLDPSAVPTNAPTASPTKRPTLAPSLYQVVMEDTSFNGIVSSPLGIVFLIIIAILLVIVALLVFCRRPHSGSKFSSVNSNAPSGEESFIELANATMVAEPHFEVNDTHTTTSFTTLTAKTGHTYGSTQDTHVKEIVPATVENAEYTYL